MLSVLVLLDILCSNNTLHKHIGFYRTNETMYCCLSLIKINVFTSIKIRQTICYIQVFVDLFLCIYPFIPDSLRQEMVIILIKEHKLLHLVTTYRLPRLLAHTWLLRAKQIAVFLSLHVSLNMTNYLEFTIIITRLMK